MQDKIINSELTKVLGGVAFNQNSGLQPVTAFTAAGSGTSEGGAAGSGLNAAQNGLSEAIYQNTAQLGQVHSTLQGQLDSLVANTQALMDNTTTKSTGSAVTGIASKYASSMLSGGLLGSLMAGLTSLFGGGSGNATPAPLVKFALPPKLSYDGGLQGGNTGAVDYGQDGQPRTMQATQPQAAQITVNVSAMDSRSFLDHSADIANAVRRAMLESSALNDVIGDL